MNSLVTIIMPTYNRSRTIDRAMKSILNQTYKNFELIIIDDGSKDNTVEKIKKYDDNRIKLIELETNMGANYARNQGLQKAKGKYITFQDSDDEALKNKISDSIKFLEDNECDIIFCNVSVFNKNKYKSLIKEQINDKQIFEKLLWGNYISLEAIFAKKYVFDDIKFDDELTRFQDWDLLLRIAQKYKIKHFNKSLELVYVQNDSITRNNKKGIDSLIRILDKYKNLFNKKQEAKIYCRIGMFCSRSNVKADKWFIKSLKTHFTFKYLMIYICYKLCLLNLFYNIYMKIK